MGSKMQRRLGIALAIGLLTAGLAVGAPAALVPPTALLVVGNLTLGTGDAAVNTRLAGLGYTVTAKLDSAAVSGDATGKAIVVVSSTCTAANVGTKFKTVTVPVLIWESGALGNMSMTGTTSGTDFGTTATQTLVTITTASHAMAAGLTGSPTVVSSAQTMSWGVASATATKVATISGASTHATIFGYDTGATMVPSTFTAPARRTGFFLQDTTASAWNTNGQALFDAAVRWTANVPVTPVNPVATPGNAQVALTWTASTGATSYNVKRATVSGGPYTTVNSPTTNSYTNTGLTNGTAYFYVISAVNANGESLNSAQVTATPVAPPTAPTGLAATGGTSQVALTWTAVSGATSYNVKRGTVSGGPYSTTVGSPTTNSFTNNTGLTNGTTYYYVVTAVNAGGESGNSAQVSGLPLAAPTGLVATPGNAQVSLTWTAVTGATSYNVKRGTVSGGPYTTVGSAATTSFVNNTGLTNGTTYYYVVTAVATGSESSNSTQVPAVPSLGNALFIVGNLTLSTQDTAIQTRLQNLGYSVTAKLNTAAVIGDATGKAIIVISASATSNSAGTTFKPSTVPILNWHPASMTSLGMSSATATIATQTQVTIQTASHPMAAGLTGNQSVISSSTINWYTVAAAATQVASTLNDSAKPAVFCYLSGATMSSGTAAARRAGLYMSTTGTLTTAGGNLFDAAVRWCTTTPPAAPTGVTRVAATGSVTISWTAVSGATSYNLKRSTTSGGPYTNVTTGIAGLTTNDTTVTNGTAYYYVVAAQNAGGEGALSAQVSATPMAAPTGLAATAGNTQVSLTWNSVTGATGYNVKRATVSGGPYTTVGTPASSPFTSTGLTNGTLYYFVVSATNTGGESSNSGQAQGTPAVGIVAPTGVTATPGDARVILTWNAVSGATSYFVKRLGANGLTWTNIATGVAGLTYTDLSLTNGTSYFYQISATNGTEGPVSAAVPGTPFGVPAGLTASAGNATVALSWGATPGALSYNVKRGSASGGPFTTIASSLAVTNYLDSALTNGTTYYYVLSAASGSAESANTAFVPATPVAGPAAPTGLAAAASTLEVTLTWTAVAGANSYTVKRSTTSGSGYVAVASGITSPMLVSPVPANGTPYYYVVSATNAGGESANSTQVASTPMAAPAGLTVAQGNTQLVLTWMASPGATGYAVKRSATSGGPYTSVGTPATTTFTNTGLTNGTTYYYVVTATNAGGASDPSGQGFGAPLGVPVAPVGLIATPGSKQIALSWTYMAGVSFNVKRSLTAGGPYTTVINTSAAGYLNTGLTNGTTYYYVVSAVNATGEGPNSAELSSAPVAPVIPPVPTMLVPSSPNTTQLLWSYVDTLSADHYELHDDSHVLIATPAGGSTSYYEGGLQENMLRSRHLHSVGESGTSAASATAAYYTRMHEPTIADFSLVVAGNQVTVTVVQPLNNPTGGTTGCQIDRSTDELNWSYVKAMNATYSFVDTGLLGSTVYYYRIQYQNGSSFKTMYSAARSVTTAATAPLAPTLAATGHGMTALIWTWNDVSNETSYELHDANHAVIGTTGAGVTWFEETGLTENTEYTRHVHAVNSAGSSPASNIVPRYTTIHTPLAGELTLTLMTPTSIKVDFGTLPNLTGQTWCRIERCTDSVSFGVVTYTTTAFTDVGLTPGMTCYYRVTFRNGDGYWGGTSPVKSLATPSGGPAEPGFSVLSSTTTSITWSVGVVSGETGYELHDNAHVVKGTAATDQMTITEAGLSENTGYDRHLHAVQGVNASVASPTVTGWTMVHTPLPGNFSVAAVSASQVTVTIIPPPNSALAQTGVIIERSMDGPTFAYVTGTVAQYTFSDTLPIVGGKAWYRFRYKNGAGAQTGLSTVLSVQPPAGPPPATAMQGSIPTRPDAILWGYVGVLGETGYELHDDAHVLKKSTAQDNLTMLETGLTENTAYSRHVHAVNAGGQSTASASQLQTTLIHSPTAADFTSFTQISPTQISMTVTVPPNSTAGQTACQIERSTDRITWALAKTMNAVYTLTDTVVSGTRYYYRVQYRNETGYYTSFSPWVCNQAVPVPTAIPTLPSGFNGIPTVSSVYWYWNDVVEEASYVLHDASEVVKATPAQGIVSYTETGFGENQPVTRHLHAVNSLGNSTATTTLTRYTLIHDPLSTDFSLTAVTGNRVDVTITAPPNAAAGSTWVLLERMGDGATAPYSWAVNSVSNPTWVFSDTSVLANCTYYYRISYMNADGVGSGYSSVKPVTTPSALPVAPTGVSASAYSTTSLFWNWSNVWDETSYELHDGAEVVKGTALGDQPGYLETGLAENTAYTRHVHARNSLGLGPASVTGTAYTQVHTPLAGNIHLTIISSAQVNVSIDVPPNGTLGWSGCVIERSVDTVNWINIKGLSPVYTASDTGLAPGLTYSYRTTYYNGDQVPTPPSPFVSITTPAGIPATPGVFSGTADSTTAIRWSWSDVAGETSYVVHNASEGLLQTLPYDTLSWLETGLTQNAAVSRHVHAANALGTGTGTAPLSRYTMVREPLATDLTVTLLNGTTAHIVVTPPPNGSLGLTACYVERSIDGINYGNLKYWDPTYTFDDPTLAPSTVYYYRVWYRNGDGVSTLTASPASILTTPPAVPGTTPFIGYHDSPSSIRWNWYIIPAATGVVIHDDNHNVVGSIAGVATEYIETGLAYNTYYSRHFHATNSAGAGPASNSFTRNTLMRDPVAADFSLSAVSATSVMITVVPPTNAYVGNTGVEVHRYQGGLWYIVGSFSNLYTRTDTGLTPGTTYLYRIRFKDVYGTNYTACSPPKTIVTPAANPTGPSNFRVQGQTTTSIAWAWDAAVGATSYDVRDAVGKVKTSLPAGVLTYNETGLGENTEQVRSLRSWSIDGPNAPSSDVSGSTAIHDAIAADFSVQPSSGTQIDVIVFSPPGAYDGQTGCEIQRSNDGTVWTQLKAFSNTYGAGDSGLTAGQTYYYRIKFRNRLGVANAAYSASRSASTAVPAAPGSVAGAGQSTSSILWTWADVPSESGFQVHDTAHALKGMPGPGVLSFTESGLAENIQFTRHLHSTNGLGSSAASSNAAAYTLVHAPVQAELLLRAVSTTAVDVTVTAPPNGTTGLTGCEIQRSPDGSAWTTVKPFSSGYLFSDTGLTSTTTYYYRFRYRNGDGVATAYTSSKATITVPQPVVTTPSKKIRNQTVAIAGTTVSGVASVHVYFNGVDQGTATLAGTTWTFSVGGKTDGVYAVTAKAFLGATPSDSSNTCTITVDLTVPAAPTNIRGTPYNNAIDVEWDASTSPDVVGYRVYRRIGTGAWSLLNTTGDVIGTKYRDTTTVNGTTYSYHVTAVDDALPN